MLVHSLCSGEIQSAPLKALIRAKFEVGLDDDEFRSVYFWFNCVPMRALPQLASPRSGVVFAKCNVCCEWIHCSHVPSQSIPSSDMAVARSAECDIRALI